MGIKKISLGWITVSDIAKAQHFFTTMLGLELLHASPEHGWLELRGKEGGTSLGVGQAHENSLEPGHNTILTFDVDDIEATKRELESKGVTFVSDIIEVPGHVKLTTFVDADKNAFQLVQQM